MYHSEDGILSGNHMGLSAVGVISMSDRELICDVLNLSGVLDVVNVAYI